MNKLFVASRRDFVPKRWIAILSIWLGWWSLAVSAEELPQSKREFFESRIRPVLIEHCYECHNSVDAAEGAFVVDHRKALLAGGDSGVVVVPGKPRASRLLAILRHEVDGLEMPAGGPKLDQHVIDDFEKWISDGAVDPRDKPPSADEIADETSWEKQFQRRRQWWSFQAITKPVPPEVDDATWNAHPIDRFIRAKHMEIDLPVSGRADAATLVRRLFVNLTGLAPSAEEVNAWTVRLGDTSRDKRDAAFSALVESLLERPAFGERWARHWMDWIRYAESHGSEGDPEIVGAWQYRDYLIRAFNQDVSLDQLIREHVAGDLLEEPRINSELGINESKIGPAHWRMVFHGFAPTDALDERVRFTDDQVNAFSKAFLGLTVSCARCHDHKFDAISQADYYAMYGILAACRPARTVIDSPERLNQHREELVELKQAIRHGIARDWIAARDSMVAKLMARDGPWERVRNSRSLFSPLKQLRQAEKQDQPFADVWKRICDQFAGQRQTHDAMNVSDATFAWDLGQESDADKWFRAGTGLSQRFNSAGEFALAWETDRVLLGIYPSGIYSHALSAKHPARLSSDDLPLGDDQELWVETIGSSDASVRYVVQDYPRNGTVYPVKKLEEQWQWQRFDLTYWSGDDVHIELSTSMDAPLLAGNKARSWFGVRRVRVAQKGKDVASSFAEQLIPFFDIALTRSPQSIEDVVSAYQQAIDDSITAWRAGTMSDAQALLLDECLQIGLLPNSLDELRSARTLIEKYRTLEKSLPVPRRVPGLEETYASEQPLYVRGNHKTPGEMVPRRFLEAIDATPYRSEISGRRELARDLLREDNPLTRRVLVNRVWHLLFGQGIVKTTDNFGRLGEKPSHPELLDWLATEFSDQGWSLKTLVRKIVSTQVWQLSNVASQRAQDIDPGNRYLTHANVRRLEAEAIRDKLLSVSGLLDSKMGGSPVSGNSNRRSVYVRVRRNSLDPFLRTFDFPEPFTCVGSRSATNVPAQSLAMMNDASVARYRNAWANRVINDPELTTDGQRIERMFLQAFGRSAETSEVERAAAYLKSVGEAMGRQIQEREQIQRKLAETHRKIEAMVSPVRKRILQSVNENRQQITESLPQPIGAWEFGTSLRDAVGGADGQAKRGAKLADGALIVRAGGHVVSEPIQTTLREKTLEVWVQLDNLTQRGGGAMTLQTPNGVVFDSIVFGEQAQAEWLAGSNNFSRTKPFGGPREEAALERPIHFAICYHADGTIAGYRDGVAYGNAYQSDGPNEFAAGQAVVSFGVRHLPAGGNRLLSGRIFSARLYDVALSAEQVAASSGQPIRFVSDERIVAALDEESQQQLSTLRNRVDALNKQLERLGPVPEQSEQVHRWSELAQALFTIKEFIYVR